MMEIYDSVKVFLSEPKGNLIGGAFVPAVSGERANARNASDGTTLGQTAASGGADVDAAVKAAAEAFPSWSASAPGYREGVLRKFGELIQAHKEELAQLESLETGKPVDHTMKIDAPVSSFNMLNASGIPSRITGETIPVSAPGMFVYSLRQPLGTIGIILPWNYPLIHFSQKAGPALAAGNCVIIKPASVASLCILRLGELACEAGLPPGVLNILTGSGSVIGSAISSHPGIRKVQITGSTAVGKGVIKAGAENLKRVTLELGSKAPNIVFDDANLEKAIDGAFDAAFGNTGQSCVAGSRLYVQEGVYDEVLRGLLKKIETVKTGPAMDEETRLGPIVDENQFNTIMNYIETGKSEGTLKTGGFRMTGENLPEGGFYIAPTVFTDVADDAVISREEIFGPVVCLYPFKTEEEVIRRANDTRYGLAAAVWTENLGRATRVSAALESGVVWVNTYDRFSSNVPFGGFKESGYGRDNGTAAIEAVTELKSVWINTAK